MKFLLQHRDGQNKSDDQCLNGHATTVKQAALYIFVDAT